MHNKTALPGSLFDIEIRFFVEMFGNVFSVFFALFDAFRKKVFDLAVNGAEIILRPCCDVIIQLIIESQRYLFSGHVVYLLL